MQVARRLLATVLLAILAAFLVPDAARAEPSAGPVKYYVVRSEYAGQPEFLFEIAQRFLGSGDRNNEIFELNKGRIQPDGLAMTKPEEILAGWVLELPSDAKGDGVQTGLLPTLGPSASAPAPAAAQTAGHGLGWLAWTLLIAGGMILLAVVGVGFWLWRRNELPPPPFMAGRSAPAEPANWSSGAAEPWPAPRESDRVPAATLATTAIFAVVTLGAGAILMITGRVVSPSAQSTSSAVAPLTAQEEDLGPRIGSSDPSLCLAASTASDGAPLLLQRCDGSQTQRWETAGDGTIRVAGRCMDVAGAAEANGTIVQLAACSGNPAQQFSIAEPLLVSGLTGKCVDVRGARVAPGVGAVIQPCTSARNRAWHQLS